VSIYGAFDGTEILRAERNLKTNVTTVDGQGLVYHCFYVSADATINGFTITGGDANGSGSDMDGGGIYIDNASPFITNCTLSANSATNAGGGIYNNHASATLGNCILSGNSADYGAAIGNAYSSSTIVNCSFYGNTATTAGGAIYDDNASPTITNCILWGDTAASGPEIDGVASSPTVTYCDIDQDGYEGTNGNIRQDPLFVNQASVDFHLQNNSPCIDIGSDSVPGLSITDFEGDLRILDGDNDGTAMVDLGADEHLPPLYMIKLVPDHGGYGTVIRVDGVLFGDFRSGMIDSADGYYRVITFSGVPGTLITNKYPFWSDTLVKVKFKKLFVDSNGDYLRSTGEYFKGMEDLPLGDYTLRVHTIWFHDLNSNGVYDEGDEIYDSVSGNPLVFTLTDEPVIYNIAPNPVAPYGRVEIAGVNFGDTQGTSVVHINNQTYDSTSGNILLWSDSKVGIRIPNYQCQWFEAFDPKNYGTRKIWITVGGQDSNIKYLKVTKPATCP
jgi:hypothetical protein